MRIISRLQAIQQKILQAQIQRSIVHPVLLLAVSKHFSPASIREAYAAGIHDFGENYVQEALTKQEALRDLPVIWHFIGAIQRNKTKTIASQFDWVHTISSVLIAERLNAARPLGTSPLNVCIQVNIDNESSKAGIPVAEVLPLAKAITALSMLTLRGLMVIPAPESDPEKQFATFSRVKQCFDAVNLELQQPMDTLSMGMSDDFVAAILAGSNLVRIGTGIFGKRAS